MPSNKSNTNSSSAGASNQGRSSNAGNPSTYRIVNDGWGSRANFQASYGLDMSTGGLEEGNQILKAFQQQDRAQNSGQKR